MLRMLADDRKMLGIPSLQPLVAVLELAPGIYSGYPLMWSRSRLGGAGYFQMMYAFTARFC